MSKPRSHLPLHKAAGGSGQAPGSRGPEARQSFGQERKAKAAKAKRKAEADAKARPKQLKKPRKMMTVRRSCPSATPTTPQGREAGRAGTAQGGDAALEGAREICFLVCRNACSRVRRFHLREAAVGLAGVTRLSVQPIRGRFVPLARLSKALAMTLTDTVASGSTRDFGAAATSAIPQIYPCVQGAAAGARTVLPAARCARSSASLLLPLVLRPALRTCRLGQAAASPGLCALAASRRRDGGPRHSEQE